MNLKRLGNTHADYLKITQNWHDDRANKDNLHFDDKSEQLVYDSVFLEEIENVFPVFLSC